jgi:hypothetical protein
MTQLTQFFANLSFSDPSVWLALGSGFAVVLMFLLLGRRQRRPATVVVSGENAGEDNPTDAWLPPPKRPDERRRNSRRSGVPTSIQLVDPRKPKRVLEGFVLDRSSGGLRVASEKPFPTGAALQVRPTNAPAETPWVSIIIRSCKETGDYFEVGCQFQDEVAWHLLLMFG